MKIKSLILALGVFMFNQGCSSLEKSRDKKPNVLFNVVPFAK